MWQKCTTAKLVWIANKVCCWGSWHIFCRIWRTTWRRLERSPIRRSTGKTLEKGRLMLRVIELIICRLSFAQIVFCTLFLFCIFMSLELFRALRLSPTDWLSLQTAQAWSMPWTSWTTPRWHFCGINLQNSDAWPQWIFRQPNSALLEPNPPQMKMVKNDLVL